MADNNSLATIQPAQQSVSVFTSFDSFGKYMEMATVLSKSQLIPVKYQNKPDDCLIAIDISLRNGFSPLMVLQNLDVVQGKPSWSGSATIALINNSPKFNSDLDWEWDNNHNGKGLSCRAFATRKSDGKVLYGSWVTWETVVKEGWLSKNGSKWQTMPEQMFRYRTASFFARAHCPEVLMGLHTTEEEEDAEAEPQTLITEGERAAAGAAFAQAFQQGGAAPKPENKPRGRKPRAVEEAEAEVVEETTEQKKEPQEPKNEPEASKEQAPAAQPAQPAQKSVAQIKAETEARMNAIREAGLQGGLFCTGTPQQ